jgi:N-acetylglucosaminyldiphosphoundecaprenol N-acetyl-beta-D-mannosaminyltransferase
MNRNRGELSAGLLIGVGAVFDFASGTTERAPAWMQKLALEWLYRLVREPRRLWRRYLSTNSSFAIGVAAEITGELLRSQSWTANRLPLAIRRRDRNGPNDPRGGFVEEHNA